MSLETEFDNIVTIVRAALAEGKQESYFPTLVAIFDGSVSINTMVRGLPESGILEAVERFGYKTGRKKQAPELLFFAAESLSSDGVERIMISGCSAEMVVVIGYLGLGRGSSNGLIAGDLDVAGYAEPGDLERVPAWRAMRGAVARSKAAWWQL